MRHIFYDLIENNKHKMSSLLNKNKISSLLSPFHFDKFTRDDFIYQWKTTTLFNRCANWIPYEDHTKEVFPHIFLQKYILLSEKAHNHLLFSALFDQRERPQRATVGRLLKRANVTVCVRHAFLIG